MANVGILLKDHKVLIPPFTHTIAGTTAIKCMKYLVSQGYQIVQELWKFDEIKLEIKEMFILGGQKVVPVKEIENLVLFEKEVPEFTRNL